MKKELIRPDRGLYGLFEHMYRRATQSECEKILKHLEGDCPPSEPARYAEACALMARIEELKKPKTYQVPKRPKNTNEGVVAYIFEGRIYEKTQFERIVNGWQKPKKDESILVQQNLVLA